MRLRTCNLHAHTLDERNNDILSRQQYQNAWKPGAEAGEKAKQWTTGAVCPHIDAAISRHKAIELSRNQRARYQKCERANDPVNIGRAACPLRSLHNRCVGDEEHNGYEKDQHVCPREHTREKFPCTLLRAQWLPHGTLHYSGSILSLQLVLHRC